MKRALIDTNILIYVTTENPFRERVKKILKKVEEVYVSTITLIEYVLVCKYKFKLEDNVIINVVKTIEENSILVDIFSEDLFNALNLSKKYNISLKEINDLILISIAKRLKLSLFTFDKKLREIAKKEGLELLD